MNTKNKTINKDIRAQIIAAGLFDYQVAARIGVTQEEFSAWLREPMTEDRQRRVLDALKGKGAV